MGPRTHTIIPEDENHCVWMDAGLVNYKLCDKNFECESCPFDTVMKEQHHPFSERAVIQSESVMGNFSDAGVAEKITDMLRSVEFPGDRLYFSNHSWLEKTIDGSCRIGIDAFLAALLQPVTGTVAVTASSRIASDSPFAWVMKDNKTFTLHTPVPGIVVSANELLVSRPSLVSSDCYHQGWIVSIAVQENAVSVPHCYTSNEFKSVAEKDMHRVEALLHHSLKQQYASVGTTMYDGGVRMSSIEHLIGEKRYMQMISRLIRLQ